MLPSEKMLLEKSFSILTFEPAMERGTTHFSEDAFASDFCRRVYMENDFSRGISSEGKILSGQNFWTKNVMRRKSISFRSSIISCRSEYKIAKHPVYVIANIIVSSL